MIHFNFFFIFTSTFFFSYPEREQLQTIYGAYLEPVLHKNLKNHSIWGSSSKISLLAGSMVQVYEQVYIIYSMLQFSCLFVSLQRTVFNPGLCLCPGFLFLAFLRPFNQNKLCEGSCALYFIHHCTPGTISSRHSVSVDRMNQWWVVILP